MRSVLSFLTSEEIELIHEASVDVLEKTGVAIHSEKVRTLLSQNGGQVQGSLVKIPRAMTEDIIKLIRDKVLLAARDPGYDLTVPGIDRPMNATSGYSPFVEDFHTGVKRGSKGTDLKDFALIGDFLDSVAFFWPIVVTTDEPPVLEEICSLDISLRNTRKHVQCSCSSGKTAEWQVRIASLVAGGEAELRRRPIFSAVSSPISPLAFEKNSAEALVTLAKAGIPVVPMTMASAGTTAPVTLGGTLTVTNAEELATLIMVKCANPNAPMIYSADPAPSNLRTPGVDSSTPEYPLLGAGCAQMAKFYGLPSMVAHDSDEGIPHDLLSFERSVLTVAMNFMTRTDLSSWLGSLDGALSASLPQLVMDAEICEKAFAYLRWFDLNRETLALDIIDVVGPGGHYLTQRHTVDHMHELWTKKLQEPIVLGPVDGGSFEERARWKAKDILSTHRAVPLDEYVEREMDDVMKKVRQEAGPC